MTAPDPIGFAGERLLIVLGRVNRPDQWLALAVFIRSDAFPWTQLDARDQADVQNWAEAVIQAAGGD